MAAKKTSRRFTFLWRNKWLTAQAKTIQQMEALLRKAADQLAVMAADGVKLEDGGTDDDYAMLVTSDPKIAKKHEMEEEEEEEEEED